MQSRFRQLFFGYEQSRPPIHEQGDLLLVLKIAIPFATVYSMINAWYGYMLLAGVLAAVVVILIPCFLFHRQGRYLEILRHVLMLVAVLVFSVLFVDGGIGNTGIYWALLFPFLAFMFMGVRLGWLWIVLFLSIQLLALVLFHFAVITLPYTAETLMFVPSMFLLFTLVGNIFELQNEKHRARLIGMNDELQQSEKALRSAYDELEQRIFQRTRELQESNTQLVVEVKEKAQALESMQQAEMKFQHAQRMESVGTLVGGIAHDFNNMLSGITANLYMAQRQMQAEDGRARLKKIGDLVMHAADMIKQLLTFARKDEAEMKQFDLSVYIKEAYKLARVSIPENIDCRFECSRERLYINGNATQIQQILMNLMNNARDALVGAESPEIRVSLSVFEADALFRSTRPGADSSLYARLMVCDNGAGIARDKQDMIFDPFFTTKEVGKGTGLGLAMVYGAMQSHHGLVEVESEPGDGACFVLYFPLLESDVETRSGQQQGPVVQGDGELILVVDDDQQLRESECELLQSMGYRVIAACNGMEAYHLFRQHAGDVKLVLMDVVMPVLGGVAAANRIRKLDASARIIFTTGYDKDNDMTSELLPEWQHVLNKPWEIEELSTAIQRSLQRN